MLLVEKVITRIVRRTITVMRNRLFISFMVLILNLATSISAVTHIDRIIKEEDIVSNMNKFEMDNGTEVHRMFSDIISLIIIREDLN